MTQPKPRYRVTIPGSKCIFSIYFNDDGTPYDADRITTARFGGRIVRAATVAQFDYIKKNIRPLQNGDGSVWQPQAKETSL
jgi:galactokinase